MDKNHIHQHRNHTHQQDSRNYSNYEEDYKEPIIELKNVSFSYGNRSVLHDINLVVNKGDFLGVVGPNGSGKSSLLKIILGILKPQTGTVKIANTLITSFKQWHRIGYISQKSNSFNSGFPATVSEVIALGLISKRGLFRRLNKDDQQQVLDTIRLVDLEEYRHQLIGQLSGGQQQRVFIAKALVANPDIMIFDEPTVGVDANSMESFYQLLEDLHIKHNKTIILVSHDIGAISTRVNRIACLNRELHFHGDNTEFIEHQDEILMRAYKHSIQVVEHAH